MVFIISLLSLALQCFILKLLLNIQLVKLTTGYFLHYDYKNETKVVRLWKTRVKKVIIVKPEAKTDNNGTTNN